jgi:hypothetical protein
MKKLFIKLVAFFKKEHISKYIVQILLFTAGLAIVLCIAAEDVVNNILGTIVGFLFSTMLVYIIKVLFSYWEDILKVTFDTKYILDLYNGDPNYRKTLTLNDTTVTFAYADSLVNTGFNFEVQDQPEKFFELDEFIMNNYEAIFAAHSNSVKINSTTIRLDDFRVEGDKCVIQLSRSTVFNHLVTNRAIDFALFDDVTLRSVFEYGPYISPYNKSKMSNHVGINALVFLSDGRLLVPRRNKVSTISKNQITSSIAVKLDFPRNGSREITTDFLLRENIIENLNARVKLRLEDLDLSQVRVQFLGFGQNLYEAGKPQFYYAVYLDNIDTDRYFHLSQRDGATSKIDVDKCIYVADYNSYEFKKGSIYFDVYDEKGHHKRISANCEMSYYANLWHYELLKDK